MPSAVRASFLTLVAVVVVACGRGEEAPPPRVVLLVVLDALAAGHVSHLGYERATTPHLDALAAEGVAFEQALAPASYTLASVPTLFTGRLPDRHGLVRDEHALPASERTLAERLRAAGYRTFAAVANLKAGPVHGLGQGFEQVFECYTGLGPRGDGGLGRAGVPLHVPRADELLPVLRARLDRLAPDERLFVYLHVLEPHAPYDPPLADKRRFVDARCRAPYVEGDRARLQASMQAGEARPEVLAGIVRLYDANVRWADANLGAVLDELRARELYEDALIVVTSDHGEAFWQHGLHGHGATVYEEELRVPLVVRHPRLPAGARVGAMVSLVDVAPTVLELAGLDCGGELDGRTLVPLLREPAGASPHELLLARSMERGGRYALRSAREKLVCRVELDPRGDLRARELELYDLAADPAEARDLAPEAPERAQRLAAELLARLRSLRAGAPAPPPRHAPADPALLEALGYAGER